MEVGIDASLHESIAPWAILGSQTREGGRELKGKENY